MTHPGEYEQVDPRSDSACESGEVVATKRSTPAVGMSLSLHIGAETDCR